MSRRVRSCSSGESGPRGREAVRLDAAEASVRGPATSSAAAAGATSTPSARPGLRKPHDELVDGRPPGPVRDCRGSSECSGGEPPTRRARDAEASVRRLRSRSGLDGVIELLAVPSATRSRHQHPEPSPAPFPRVPELPPSASTPPSGRAGGLGIESTSDDPAQQVVAGPVAKHPVRAGATAPMKRSPVIMASRRSRSRARPSRAGAGRGGAR